MIYVHVSGRMKSDPILNKNMQIFWKQIRIAGVCKINVAPSLRKLFHWFFFYLKAELFLFHNLFTDLVLLNAIDTKSDEYYRENETLKLDVDCV